MSSDEHSTEGRSYLSDVAKAAPIFGLKALIGDLPKGGIEYAVENKAAGSPRSLPSLLSQGLAGRGSGRALGAALGVLTAPLFLQGVRLAGSSDSDRRNKGLALLAGSAAIHQGVKGVLEDGFEARRAGANFSKSIRAGLLLGGIRSLYKAPLAAAVGMSIVSGRKKSNESGSTLHKYVAPSLMGATIGAISRAGEGAAKELGTVRHLPTIVSRAAPRALGGAAGGLFGGLIAAGVTDVALRALDGGKEKKAAVPGFDLAGIPGVLAKDLPAIFGLHGLTGAISGGIHSEGLRALSPRLANVGVEARARNLALGIREGIAGFTTPGIRGTTAMNMTAREFTIERSAGIRLGHFLRGFAPERRMEVLRRMAAFTERNPQMRYTSRGHSTPVTGALSHAVQMIEGTRPTRTSGGVLTRAFDKFQRIGRLKGTTGLPDAGRLRAEPTKLRSLLEEAPSAALGAAGLVGATSGVPVMSSAAGKYGTHLMFNAVKGGIVHTIPGIHRGGQKMMAQGFWKGLSGLGETKPHAGWRAMEYVASPSVLASRAIGEAGGMTARALIREHGHLSRLKQLRRKDYQKLTVNIGAPMLAAAGAGKMLRDKVDE